MNEQIRPAILDHPLWQTISEYLSPQRDATQTRGHFNFRKMPDDLYQQVRDLELPCIGCGAMIHPFRGTNGSLSLHFTGIRTRGHEKCSYGSLPRQYVVAMQVAVGQGGETKRVLKEKGDQRQQRLEIVGGEFLLPSGKA